MWVLCLPLEAVDVDICEARLSSAEFSSWMAPECFCFKEAGAGAGAGIEAVLPRADLDVEALYKGFSDGWDFSGRNGLGSSSCPRSLEELRDTFDEALLTRAVASPRGVRAP